MTPEDREEIREIVAAAEQRIKEQAAAAEQRREENGAAAEQRLKEHATEIARDLQTEMLRGLEGFARGNFARFHSLESNQTDINTRMAALEERVLYLETRNRPPQ